MSWWNKFRDTVENFDPVMHTVKSMQHHGHGGQQQPPMNMADLQNNPQYKALMDRVQQATGGRFDLANVLSGGGGGAGTMPWGLPKQPWAGVGTGAAGAVGQTPTTGTQLSPQQQQGFAAAQQAMSNMPANVQSMMTPFLQRLGTMQQPAVPQVPPFLQANLPPGGVMNGNWGPGAAQQQAPTTPPQPQQGTLTPQAPQSIPQQPPAGWGQQSLRKPMTGTMMPNPPR